MALTIIPTIQQGKVVEVSVSFDKPLTLSDFRKLIKKLDK